MGRASRLISLDDRVQLRSIDVSDLDLLREWKNANRQYFFDREKISRDQQATWFAGFLRRSEDHMFMVQVDGSPIGCMGFRLRAGEIDFYNIIRGRRHIAPGVMHLALQHLIRIVQDEFPGLKVRVRVVAGNPATSWYRRCGFREVETVEDHVLMEWVDTSG